MLRPTGRFTTRAIGVSGNVEPRAAAIEVAVGVVGRLWRGEVPLRAAFWLCGVVGAVAIQATLTPIELWPDRARATLGQAGIAAIAVLAFVYVLFSLFVVWHSADRYPGPRTHAWLARLGSGLILFATVIDVASSLIVAFGA